MTMTIDRYAQLLVGGAGSGCRVAGFSGRIIRGTRPEHFLRLSGDDPDRKIVFLTGPDGLSAMLGRSGYDILTQVIGQNPEHVENKIANGTEYRLVVFPEDHNVLLATWANVLQLVANTYHGLMMATSVFQAELERRTFASIESCFDYRLIDVEKAGRSDPRFVTHERFLESGRTLKDLRAFLYFTVGLREDFLGDGYVHNPNGASDVVEYLSGDRPLSELGDYRIIPLRVRLPATRARAA